jgi:hypothetical protein
MSATSINVRMDTFGHGMSHPFERPGAVVNGLTGIKKRVGEVSLHFQLLLNTLGF